jgi:uncharacterized repeat protein (TIGR02543 family)
MKNKIIVQRSSASLNYLAVLLCLTAMVCFNRTASASIAYGSINNFDTVNDTGHECHGFEIDIEDCHSTAISYTYNYNHYGVPNITEDNSVAGHPKTIIRWESKKNVDGTWAAYTAIPAAPIPPTQGHQFTNPAVNFGGEHFGVGYNAAVSKVSYNWLIDNGAGVLVNGGAVQVSTPTFTYYPPVVVVGVVAPPQVQAVIAPPPPPAPPATEFGPAVWVKEIRTTTHNNNEVKLRDLVSADPADPNGKNWKNGEPDEVEIEWRILQTSSAQPEGGPNNKLAAAAEALPNGNEVVTRRYEFYKYTGPLDVETGQAMGDTVGPDGIHGSGTVTYADHWDFATAQFVTVTTNMATKVVVGDFTGAQMAAVAVAAPVGLIDHVSEGRVNTAYTARTLVIEGALPFIATRDGALPAGMDFDTVTGVLSGTPAASGQFNFKVSVTDGVNPDVSKTYTLIIAAAGEVLPPTSLLDTTAKPVGTGTATGDGAYEPGSNVTVNATAAPGFHFVNWMDNDKIVSTSASYTFAIDVNHSLVANFALTVPQRSIAASATPLAGGTTSGAGTVDDGTSVTLLATPTLGYVFTKWTESGVQVSTSTSYTFNATANRVLVANFTPVPTYAVATSAAPAAGGSTTGGGQYSSGTSVTVTATPQAGYVFTGWKAGGVLVSSSPTYNFKLTAARTLVANFVTAGTQAVIVTSANPVAGGTTSGGGNFASGDSVTLVATAKAGYAFSGWKEGAVTASASSSYTFVAGGSRTLVANFIEAFVVTAGTSPPLGGTTEMDSAHYKTGEIAQAIATPATGFSFGGWTENGVVLSTNATYSFTITGNRTIVANFISNTGVTINTNSASASGGGITGDGAYKMGDLGTVSAVPDAGYAFVNWTEGGADVSSEAEYTFSVGANNRLLVAHMAPAVSVDASSSSSVGGSVSGPGTYGIGAGVTLLAIPNERSTFTHWLEGGNVVSTSPNYNFTVGSARSLVAVFNPVPDVAMTPGAPGSDVQLLSWSAADPYWVLQESTDLVTWVNSPRPVSASGGRKAASANTSVGNRFFRLAHP